MKSRHILIAATGFVGLTGVSVCLGGNKPQPSAPPVPPAWKQPAPAPAQSPAKTSPSSTSKDSKNDKNNPPQHPDRRYPYGYPYGYPGYGQPTAGVYYPGSGVSSTNGNPNAVQQNNANPNANGNGPLFNNNPVPDNSKPAPTPVAQTPAAPPDPDIIQANADVSAAMEQLRDDLLKTNPDYQAAIAAKKAAQEESATVHANDQSTPDQIFAAATKVLEASRHVAEIERDAAVTNQGVQDAQSKLKTAIANHAANAAATAAAK